MKARAQNEHEDGLLEYLEDIIGTTKYKEPIEQASQEVETLNEERGEKMNRLRVVEREKAALEVRPLSLLSLAETEAVSGQEARSRGLFTGLERVDEEEIAALAMPHVYSPTQYRDHQQSYREIPSWFPRDPPLRVLTAGIPSSRACRRA
jgi:methylmalonyl-CoA mutase N-terminal domain/subunit